MQGIETTASSHGASSIGSYEVQVCCMQMQFNQHDGICMWWYYVLPHAESFYALIEAHTWYTLSFSSSLSPPSSLDASCSSSSDDSWAASGFFCAEAKRGGALVRLRSGAVWTSLLLVLPYSTSNHIQGYKLRSIHMMLQSISSL